MKKITFLVLLIAPLFSLSQTLTNTTFDTDVSGWAENGATMSWNSTEGFTAAGSLQMVATSSGDRVQTSPNTAPVSGAGDYLLTFKVKGADGAEIDSAIYQGSLTGGPAMTISGTDWNTYEYLYTGIVDGTNINIRIIANTTGTFYIDDVSWVKVNVVTENSWVTNPNFEASNDWTDNGSEASSVFDTAAPHESSQNLKTTFNTDQSTTFTIDNAIYDFGKTVNPSEINTTLWVKASSTAIQIQVLYDIFDENGTKITGNNTGAISVSAIDTWEQVSFSKTISDPFNQIQYRLKVKQGAVNGDVIEFDQVAADFTYNQLQGTLAKNTYDFAIDDIFGFFSTDGTVTDGGTTLDFNADGSTAVPKIFQNFYTVDASNQSLYIKVDANASNADEWSLYFKDGIDTYHYYGWETLNSGGPTVMKVDLASKAEWTGTITEFVLRFRNSGGATIDTNTLSISKIAFFNNNETITAGNWDIDAAWLYGKPLSTQNVTINHLVAINGSDEEVNNLTANAPLNISDGSSLTVHGNLDANQFVNVGTSSGSQGITFASLIVEGTASDNVFYNRFVNEYNGTVSSNDLISPPVQTNNAANFLNANQGPLLTQGTTPVIYAFAPFNNNSGSYENLDSNNTASLVLGTGFRTATDDLGAGSDGQPIRFQGDLVTLQVDKAITEGTDPTYGTWNLIGNPYPSYLDFDSFFAANSSQFDTGAFQAIYGYNATSSKWTIWNAITGAGSKIAPAQGFFVKSKTGGGTVSFTPAMRTIGTSDDFIVGRASSDVQVVLAKLLMSKGSDTYHTDIYFNSNATRNLDPGYDAGAFTGASNNIFTHLVEGNTGIDMAIQALAYSDFNDVVVPLGINAGAGEQFSIALDDSATTLPDNIEVYLEDSLTGSFTLLNTSDHIATPTTDINGTGRFYLHFTATTLSLDDNTLNRLQIYSASNPKTLFIKGMVPDNSQATIYDVQGRTVKKQRLDATQLTNQVDTASLDTGFYIVKVSNGVYSKTQKIILR